MTRSTIPSLRIVIAGCLLAGLAAACDLSALEPPVTPSPTPIPTPTPIPSFFRPTPLPQPTFLVYVVGPGDTLSSIANAYATKAQSIAYWNRAAYPSLDPDSPRYDPNTIQVGWTLLLIPFGEVDPEDLPPPAATPTPSLPSNDPSASPQA
jgi:LysM domain